MVPAPMDHRQQRQRKQQQQQQQQQEQKFGGYQSDRELTSYNSPPEERRDRYEHLKSSVAVLRSRCRSTPSSTPTPTPSSPPSSVDGRALVPFAADYFASSTAIAATTTTRRSTRSSDRGQSNCLVNQIEAGSLLESYAMQALRLDCDARLKDAREEMDKVREKLKDKVRRTELFERELEKQRRKLEGRIAFFSDRSKVLENQLEMQASRHKQELWAQSDAFNASLEEEDDERRQQIKKLVADYEGSMASLKDNNEKQLAEIQALKHEFSTRLEQMEKCKQSTEEQLKYLDGQLKLVARQSETLKMSYEEQDRDWTVKLQHITAMHQYQTKALSEDFEFQIDKLKKDMKEERDQQNSKLQAYKAQKLLDMENVEQRVKGVLDLKDNTISKLKLELKMLHQQLNESATMLDDDSQPHADEKPCENV